MQNCALFVFFYCTSLVNMLPHEFQPSPGYMLLEVAIKQQHMLTQQNRCCYFRVQLESHDQESSNQKSLAVVNTRSVLGAC